MPSLTCAALEDPRVATWLLRPAVLVEDLRFDKLKHDWLRDHTSGVDRRATGGKKTSARGGTASTRSKLSSSSKMSGAGNGKVKDVVAPRNMDEALRQMASDLRDVLVVHSRISMELEQVEMMNVFQQQEMPLVPVLAKMETVRVLIRLTAHHAAHNTTHTCMIFHHAKPRTSLHHGVSQHALGTAWSQSHLLTPHHSVPHLATEWDRI